MTLFVMAIIGIAFIIGLVIGAYGHKWMASKAAAIGITTPTKLP